MRKILTLLSIGMLVMVGFATIALGEDDESNKSNRAPSAPIIIQEKSDMEEETYRCTFYSTDPDGDQVYYDITWEKIDSHIVLCDDDDAVTPWLGPFNSGEEVTKDHSFTEKGTYKVTLRAKDVYNNIGPSTEITVTYKKVKMFQLPIFIQLFETLREIFKL